MDEKRITNKRMKEINLCMVLNLIRRNQYITRSELVTHTGLTAASITNIVNELREKGYIELMDSGKSFGGRKPELICLKPNAEYAVGLEMTTTRLICVVGNLQADVLARIAVPISVSMGRDAIIETMVSTANEAIVQSGLPRERIIGLGLAIPGPCDYKNGVMLNPPNFPDWIQVPIREILTHRLEMPVFICKETSCDGLAEYWFGKAIGGERILAVHIGMVGIGGAFVDQGSVFRSDSHETMDIGHNIVQTDGYPCVCGSRGCLEAQAGGYAAVRYAREFIIADRTSRLGDPESVGIEDVLRGARENDIACVHAVEKCASYLATALRNVILLLAPDRIFCGGDFVDRCPLLLTATKEYLNRISYPNCAHLSLEPFSFGRDNGAIGALALVFGRSLGA